MTTYYRATIECDAQSSVKCAGVIGVQGEPTQLPRLAAATMEAKGWRRTLRQDICPSCFAALAERAAQVERGRKP